MTAESDLKKRRNHPVLQETNKGDTSSVSGCGGDTEEVDEEMKEYLDYFKKNYDHGGDERILGLDGLPLFCLIYIVLAGFVFSVLFISIYIRGPDHFPLFRALGTAEAQVLNYFQLE